MGIKSNVSSPKRKATVSKPEKPYADFPLFPHATRRWAKKIKGKTHYFGKWDDPQAAVDLYTEQREDLHAGRTPRPKSDGVTICDLCNQFLTTKRHLLDTREITERTFRDYYLSCERIIDGFGKNRIVEDIQPGDFEKLRVKLASTLGPVALGNEINRIRMVFKYGYDQALIDHPMRYGQSFKRPSRKTLRKTRAANGKRMFEADDLTAIINQASYPLKAMILLGVNCGFGQSDISALPQSAIDLDGGWIDFPRPKTGIERRCPLWPQTVDALRVAIEARPASSDKADDDQAFLTKYGNLWVRANDTEDETKRGTMTDSVAQEFGKVLGELGLRRRGLNFYALRHTFETIAGESRDQVAVNAIMGHVDNTMAGAYRERISDERLQDVVDTVHGWLFPSEAKGGSHE
jgi:integrase